MSTIRSYLSKTCPLIEFWKDLRQLVTRICRFLHIEIPNHTHLGRHNVEQHLYLDYGH